jgi:hypothetical protein
MTLNRFTGPLFPDFFFACSRLSAAVALVSNARGNDPTRQTALLCFCTGKCLAHEAEKIGCVL